MFRIPLPSEDSYLLLEPRFGELTSAWQVGLLGVLLLLPLALVIWLYRYELKLIPRLPASLLLLLRLLVLVVLWCVVGLQPSVAREQEEELIRKVVVAVDLSGSMETRDPQRSLEEKQGLARALGVAPGEVDGLTRRDVAVRILRDQGLLDRLGQNHQVELVGFDKTLTVGGDLLGASAAPSKPETLATDLRLPLGHALQTAARDGSKPLALVLFSDGQHNAGLEPAVIQKAKELARAQVPIYPVVLGAKDPPVDIEVLEVVAPATSQKNSDIAVKSRIKVSGVPAGNIAIELYKQGKKIQEKIIAHDGKTRVRVEEFKVTMEDVGSYQFEVKAAAVNKDLREVSRANNTGSALVRVTDDKARVLLVDGEARWEYHYLAAALKRDPGVKPDLVVFSQPRIGELPQDKLELLGHPRIALPEIKEGAGAAGAGEDDPLHTYDCIFLGDVPAAKLPLGERRRLERYVAERGGTLVLLAGKRFMPGEYLTQPQANSDPLLKMLPISEARLVKPVEGFSLSLTAEGKLTPFLQMEDDSKANLQRWSEFPKHYWALAGRPKPGASTLAFLDHVPGQPQVKETPVKEGPEKTQGAIVLQNYGFGQVLFLGIDSTWRWRFKTGDTYHHRFWGQVVRWAAADRFLPGGNRFVRFGSRQPVVHHGQGADIQVRLAEELPALAKGAVARVRLWRQLDQGKEEQAALAPLAKNAKQAKLLEAQVRDLPAGQYRIEVDIPDLGDKLPQPPEKKETGALRHDMFKVLPPEEGELFDLASNWPLMRALAQESAGRMLTPETFEDLLPLLTRQVVTQVQREEQKLWQDEPLVWWTFTLLIGLLTLEWIGRKWAGLP